MAPSVAELSASDIKRNVAQNTSNGAPSETAKLDASKLTFTPRKDLKPVPAWKGPEYMTQKCYTDHMITAAWTEEHGWEAPEMKPYGPLSLMPSASCLQYATECFEGLKVYRGHDGGLRLFRPELNAQRMQKSVARIALPTFDPPQLTALMQALCAQDAPRWLPRGEAAGRFLYLRPTMIATEESLGVQRPKAALLYIIIALMPPWNEIAGGMKLLASEQDTVRAWPGGFGFAKLGANYGPTLVAQGEARRRGFNQVLWLLPKENGRLGVTEAGASNFIVIWKTAAGKTELVTAPINNGIILDGVTRRSVLEIARSQTPELEVVERDFDMTELVEAVEQGRLVEAFAAGTAFFLSPVTMIQFGERKLDIPASGGAQGWGKYVDFFKTALEDIMYGRVQHKWGDLITEA